MSNSPFQEEEKNTMFSLPTTPNTSNPSPPPPPPSSATLTSTTNPLISAEKTHGIAIDEPTVAHQAILFILDVLIRNNQAMPIVKLYDSFADRSFTPQMLRAVGGNEQGLQQFLLRYPSLFTVTNDTVSANSATPVRTLNPTKSHQRTTKSTASPASSSGDANENDPNSTASTSTTANEPVWDAKTMREIEQEAINFFKKQLTKREEEWLPIVSVAGHASQASADVRKYVGPQNEFKVFLSRYPHIFVVRDEFCGLKGKADQPGVPFPPPSPPPKRRIMPNNINGTSLMLTRSTSFKSGIRPNYGGNSMPSTPTSMTNSSILLSSNSTNNSSRTATPRLTPNEVKAVHYVMRLLHKHGRTLVQTVPALLARTPEHLLQLIGFTREDLIAFFKRHNAIFQLHVDGTVSVKSDAVRTLLNKTDGSSLSSSSSITTTTTTTTTTNPPTPGSISSSSANAITAVGVVIRIFPKYGILNMENNEQVFFDIQSCHFETFNDLTCVLNPGDTLHFSAILGPKEGSTKWKSLKTWSRQTARPNLVHSASTNNLSSLASSNNGTNNGSNNNAGNNGGGYVSPPSFDQYSNGYAAIDQDLNAYQMPSDLNSGNGTSMINSFDESMENSNSIDQNSSFALMNSSNSNRHSRVGLPTLDEEQYPMPKMAAGLDAEVLRRNLQQVAQRVNAISLREVHEDSGGRLISQGCQTTSTGEILATNIHTE